MNASYSSIRDRLAGSYLLVSFISVLLISIAVSYHHHKQVQNEKMLHRLEILKAFGHVASKTILSNNPDDFLTLAAPFMEETKIKRIAILDASGNIWAGSDADVPKNSYQKTIQELRFNPSGTHPAAYLFRENDGITQAALEISLFKTSKYILIADFEFSSWHGWELIHPWFVITFLLALLITGILPAGFFSNRFVAVLNQLKNDQDQLKAKLNETIAQKNETIQILKNTEDNMKRQVEHRTAELRKQIEEKLLLEEQYRKVVDASPVPFVVFNMDGTPIHINPAFTTTFGWSLEEFQADPTRYIPEKEFDLNVRIRRNIISGRGGTGIETSRYNKAGQLLNISLSYDVWRGKNNAPIGCVVMLHDVTQSKKMEQQLFQSRKMEAMGTLAGGIAHDFNNILSGIFAFSQLAQKHAGDALKAREHIQQIVKGAQRASGLVQQILTYCRQTETKKQAIHFDLVLREALDLFRSTLPEQIILTEDIAAPVIIEADATQIHQVIMNLATNAVQAIGAREGTISIRLREIHRKSQEIIGTPFIKPGEYASLEIHDTGHGMDTETLEKAFDPYFTTKDLGKGTGFGLALVKAIVESHEGYIEVHSQPGKGARFDIFLPLKKAPDSSLLPQDHSSPKVIGGTERIMIVDDEESIRLATREFLEDYGYQTSIFKNAENALEAFKRNPDQFDLVCTDMNMPGMTGDVLVKKLLSIRKDIPVILCTGYSEKINESQALKAGVKFFLQKPVASEHLEAMIRKALGSST